VTDGSEVRLTKERDPTTGFGIVNVKELLAWVQIPTASLFYNLFELTENLLSYEESNRKITKESEMLTK
jgi:hypothetical protein